MNITDNNKKKMPMIGNVLNTRCLLNVLMYIDHENKIK